MFSSLSLVLISVKKRNENCSVWSSLVLCICFFFSIDSKRHQRTKPLLSFLFPCFIFLLSSPLNPSAQEPYHEPQGFRDLDLKLRGYVLGFPKSSSQDLKHSEKHYFEF